ncbi:MAG: 2-oxo-4-hydroxy-4-carboxy-5-ureidoimidazoline decarboxylase [Verrucomicrobiota bacterium]
MHLDEINRISVDDFVLELGEVYESSPWVAESIADHRPFDSVESLAVAMRHVVDGSDPGQKLALLRAHPDLGGKLARRGKLGAHSTQEQSRLGLERLEEEEFRVFSDLNSAYQQKFGFPFIICVALVDKAGILAAFRKRLEHAEASELSEALRQVHLIAEQRLKAMFGTPDP